MTTPRFSFFSTPLPNIEGPSSWGIGLNDEGFKCLPHLLEFSMILTYPNFDSMRELNQSREP